MTIDERKRFAELITQRDRMIAQAELTDADYAELERLGTELSALPWEFVPHTEEDWQLVALLEETRRLLERANRTT